MKKILYVTTAILLLALTPSVAKAKTANASKTMTTTINGTEFSYQFHGNSKQKVDIIKVSNVDETLIFPAKLDGYTVHGIGGNHYDTSLQWDETGKKVKKVIIKKGIKKIGYEAFEGNRIPDGSNIEAVFIPQSVKRIGPSAFSNNAKIEKVAICNQDTKIECYAFSECKNLKKINLPKGEFTGKIEEGAFYGCDLRSLRLPYMKKQKQIGRFAFAENENLKKITFSKKYTKIRIGKDWFTDCSKAQITIGKNVKAFSSEINANAGTVRLLGKKTKLLGFRKPGASPYYYIQYETFIVPKGAKALKVLKKAKYGKVNDGKEERYSADGNNYFGYDMKKVKVVIE